MFYPLCITWAMSEHVIKLGAGSRQEGRNSDVKEDRTLTGRRIGVRKWYSQGGGNHE